MAMAKEKQYFDLEFFMRSTDVGLYNVAKEIFSHLSARDLQKMRQMNKTFYGFLKNEKDFLWNKFEKVTLKVLEFPGFTEELREVYR